MKKRTNKLPLIISGSLLSLSQLAMAADNDKLFNLQIGIAGVANTSVYSGITEEHAFVPLVMASYKNFYFHGDTAGYRFYQTEKGSALSLELGYTSDGYNSTDGSVFSGMDDRKGAWEIGLAYETMVVGGQFSANLMQDIGESHQGLSVQFNYERPFWMGPSHMVSWYAGADFWDQERTNYYYGVNTSEVKAGRQEYKASANTSLYIGTNAVKQLNSKLALMLNAQYLMVGEAVDDSPLVNRDDQWSMLAAVIYQF